MNTPEYIDDMICLLQELKRVAEKADTEIDKAIVDEAIQAMKAHESEIEYYIRALS